MISEYMSNEQAAGQSCHASSVAPLADGRCLATWFSGTHEKNPDVVIKLGVRSARSGWGEPFTVAAVRNAEGEPVAHWNPVLFVHGGVVTLYFKIGATIDIWRQYLMECPADTADFADPSAWSTPVEMVEGPEGEAGRGTVRTEQITLDGGATWLAGGSTEATDLDEVRKIRAAAKADGNSPHAASLEVGWRSFVDRSFDGGRTWERSPYLTVTDTHVLKGKLPSTDGAEGEIEVQVGLIQPSIWASSETDVHVLCRSNGGAIYRADSTDSGRTWGPAVRTAMPNNNSGIDVCRLTGSGRLVMAHNPTGTNWGARTPLRLSVSSDNGHTWPIGLDVETTPDSEFSYPACVATSTAEGDGVCLTYTWNRVRMKCVWISEVELLRSAVPCPVASESEEQPKL
jgi:predicted neuraminidase